MDLRTVVNGLSNAINENMIVSVARSTGYTQGDDTNGYRQQPTYASPVSGPAQLQALDGVTLRQMDGLNIQGVLRVIYLRGALAGVIRASSAGGDVVTIAAPAPAMYQGTWLIVKVLEQWPLWAKCVINLQVPA